MQIFKIILLITVITALHAKEINWTKYEPKAFYYSSDYKLKKHVAYMEIEWEKKEKNKYIIIKRKSIDSFGPTIKKQFRSLKPRYTSKANFKHKGNAAFIDTKGKIWQMDMIEDVVSLLGDIDTPVEAQLVAWLYMDRSAIEYSKTENGYKLHVEAYKGKKCFLDEVFIATQGTFSTKRLKRGCQKIAKKKMVKNKYIKYERFTDIVIDKKENLYLLGSAIDVRSENAEVVTIDKYNRNGKQMWHKVIRSGYSAYAENLALDSDSLYFLDNSSGDSFIIQYTKGGKFVSSKAYAGDNKKRFDAIHTLSNKNTLDIAPYYRNLSGHEIQFVKQVLSRNGNIYAIGTETIHHEPKNVLPEECGMGDPENGALIVKFDKRGDQVWSKVIDLKREGK